MRINRFTFLIILLIGCLILLSCQPLLAVGDLTAGATFLLTISTVAILRIFSTAAGLTPFLDHAVHSLRAPPAQPSIESFQF